MTDQVSILEIGLLIECIEETIDKLSELLLEPGALSRSERGEIGKLIAEYKWLPVTFAIKDLINLKEKLIKLYKAAIK